MINICVPVLKRYDLLRKLLLSLDTSELRPTEIYIINNGRDSDKLSFAMRGLQCVQDVNVLTPSRAMGVAESWNWFIDNVQEERVISNDDIVFAPDSIGKLLAPDADLIWAKGCGFACFVLRDACVNKIGKFDESISPGYGYYEDEDYLQRLDGRGTREPSARSIAVDSNVIHEHSATLKAASHEELMEHHRKFKIAQQNYARKWGVVFA
jgi:GT2 family glycosyltransferase